MRGCYGVSPYQAPAYELLALTEAALDDTSTPLFAAVAGWRFPASVPQIVTMGALVGERGEQMMPWHQPPPKVSDEETHAAHMQLLDEIHFTT